MKLDSNSLNIRYNAAVQNGMQQSRYIANNSSPSFKGVEGTLNEVARKGGGKLLSGTKGKLSKVFGSIGSGIKKFFREQILSGTDYKYEHSDEILKMLRGNFGSTFDNCFKQMDRYSEALKDTSRVGRFFKKAASVNNFGYTIDKTNNTITFHKNSFARNVVDGLKEFTVGAALDACIATRKLYRKIMNIPTDGAKVSKGFGKILDSRIAKKKALDSFYRVSGVFEQAVEGLGNIAEKNRKMSSGELYRSQMDFLSKNIKNLAQDSVQAASKKVGKYNTKTERALNRLGTGLVSASFAATDFYNISMLQNNDEEKANASAAKRFAQDMRRQGLTAGITFVVLGAFQNKVNKSIPYAALSLGGVTLASEILSRKMGKIPLKPLSPEEAAKEAEKKEKKKLKEAQKSGEPVSDTKKEESSTTGSIQNTFALLKNSSDNNSQVFNVFTNKINETIQNQSPSFKANTPDDKQKEEKKHKATDVLKTALKVVGGIIGASLAIGYLRSKNVLGIDSAIKAASKAYQSGVKKLTTKELILPKDQVDDFLKYMEKQGFKEQHSVLSGVMDDITSTRGTLSGESSLVKKILGNKAASDGKYYDMGKVDAKARKAIFGVILYPIETVSKLIKKGNTLVKRLFVKDAKKDEAEKLTKEAAVSFIHAQSEKYKKAAESGNLENYKKELADALTRHFSEANSKNKNTSIAMISRILITFITGYFFVNDYRNEVLIESKGKDVDGANAVMKERIGHKISNFFLNSMFMDFFNTTFEKQYLGSLAGATAVAMATETTNESAVRKSICTPLTRMNRDEIIKYENEQLNKKGLFGKYCRWFMKMTGKKPLSAKANKNKDKDKDKNKTQVQVQAQAQIQEKK